MGYFRKKLERRTYSQDRYYMLIKRQKAGEATFNELIELDEIVNRVPDIREIVIRENFMTADEPGLNEPFDQDGNEYNLQDNKSFRSSFWNKLQSLIDRIFTTQISAALKAA
jgi:hypothetical protein